MERTSVAPSEKQNKKTPEQYAEQVNRIASKLIERTLAVEPQHRTDKDGNTINAYDSTTNRGDKGPGTVMSRRTESWVKGRKTSVDQSRDEGGTPTGNVVVTNYDSSIDDSKQMFANKERSTYVDATTDGPQLREGVSNVGGMDQAVADTAQNLAYLREGASRAEAQQRAAADQAASQNAA